MLAAAVFVILLLTSFVIIHTSFSYQKCCKDYYKERYTQTEKQNISTLNIFQANLVCAGRVIDRHNGIVTAIATLIIACFTFLLLIVAHTQNRLIRTIERAFVFVKTPESRNIFDELNLLRSVNFGVVWENAGTTPTKQMTVEINVTPVEDANNFVYGDHTDTATIIQRTVLGPKAEVFIGASHGTGQVEQVAISPVVHKEKYLFLWGECDYEDIFGGRHCTEFCFEVKVAGVVDRSGARNIGYNLYGEHNRHYDKWKS